MKENNSALNRKLKQYSAFAASILAGTTITNAQIVYTDISDITLSSSSYPGQQYSLDLDNNGIVDFIFRAIAYGSANRNFIGVVMYPYYTTQLNAIAGNVETIGNDFLGYPSALALNENIDDNLNFFKLTDLVNTLNNFDTPVMFSDSDGDFYGHWQGGISDHFVGFKFSPDGINTYFGWARCDISADASSITIKDYAYNSVAGTPLFAGQGSLLDVPLVNHQKSFNVFGYEGVLNVYVNDGKFDGTTVTVTNTSGGIVVKQALTDNQSRIDLNPFAKGIYLITIQRDEEIFSIKISFR